MDDCLADTAKFQDVYQRTKFVFEAVKDIESSLRPCEDIAATQVEKARASILERQSSFLFEKAR